MSDSFSRRDVLTKSLPAAALAGASLGALSAFAQDTGNRRETGGEPRQREYDSVVQKLVAQAYQNGQYRLPALPYAYNALEPHIDEQTMRLHHDRHHQSYVDGLNKAIRELAQLRGATGEPDMARLYGLERDLSFNSGGHTLHTIFWGTMAPSAGGRPGGSVARAINDNFSSFDAFKNYYSNVAKGVKGSGWAVLAYEPIGDTLVVFGVNEHDTKIIGGTHPLLPIDVWEHAYYLKYQNNRANYVTAWWNTVNWQEVDRVYNYYRSLYKDGDERDTRRNTTTPNTNTRRQ